MKKVNVLSIALICLLFLSSFGLVEYGVIQPKFNIDITDSTKLSQIKIDLLESKSFDQEQNGSQKQKKEESAEQNVISWSERIAMAMKMLFLKLTKLIISFFFR